MDPAKLATCVAATDGDFALDRPPAGFDFDPRADGIVVGTGLLKAQRDPRTHRSGRRGIASADASPMDEVLAMIIMGKLPDEVTQNQLAGLHG